MKHLILMLLLILSMHFPAFSQEVKGINFEKDLSWSQVKEKAKKENKYIFVDVFATWCGPCKMMDKDVYSNWRVGDAMKNNYISIKVQMDSSVQDDDQIKSWYADAQKLSNDYKIHVYPTFLFFSPEAMLVHEEAGYKKPADFIRATQLARDPKKPLYYGQYEAYKQGKKDYKNMGDLALFTQRLIGDRMLAGMIAKDCKENYLDKLPKDSLCTWELLNFIGEFYTLINSKDYFFQLCYEEPERVDKIINYKGWALFQVTQTVTREEIVAKVIINGKAVKKHPNWNKLQSAIARKYHTVDARRILLDYQINYYRNLFPDWLLWAKYKNEMINIYPPRPPFGLAIYTGLNMYGAWDAFLHCPDHEVLVKALDWINLALKFSEGDNEENKNKGAYLDTKANLLYKLSRKDEALSVEKEAVSLSPMDTEIMDAYRKMQRGEQTWPFEK